MRVQRETGRENCGIKPSPPPNFSVRASWNLGLGSGENRYVCLSISSKAAPRRV